MRDRHHFHGRGGRHHHEGYGPEDQGWGEGHGHGRGGPGPEDQGWDEGRGRGGRGPGWSGPGRGPWAGPFWFGRGRGPGRGPFGPFGPFGDGPFGDDPFGGPPRRQRRGDIRLALLELLAEQPRHGYDLIKELERRFGGFYRPSPGSVYPTLQLLEDEGHLTSATVEGKRTYTITDSGRRILDERGPDQRGPGHHHGPPAGREDLGELRESVGALVGVVMQAARHGTPEQVRAMKAALDRARREIHASLSEPGTATDEA
jgi:DNA-binding PadR family transcriptional regulator